MADQQPMMRAFAQHVARDAEIARLESLLLDYSGHVHAGLSAGRRRVLVREVTRLRAENGWKRLDMRGRDR